MDDPFNEVNTYQFGQWIHQEGAPKKFVPEPTINEQPSPTGTEEVYNEKKEADPGPFVYVGLAGLILVAAYGIYQAIKM